MSVSCQNQRCCFLSPLAGHQNSASEGFHWGLAVFVKPPCREAGSWDSGGEFTVKTISFLNHMMAETFHWLIFNVSYSHYSWEIDSKYSKEISSTSGGFTCLSRPCCSSFWLWGMWDSHNRGVRDHAKGQHVCQLVLFCTRLLWWEVLGQCFVQHQADATGCFQPLACCVLIQLSEMCSEDIAVLALPSHSASSGACRKPSEGQELNLWFRTAFQNHALLSA